LVVAACGSGASPILEMFLIDEIAVGDTTLTVLVADTATKRQQGLRDIETLDGYDGMLFVFEETRPATFGMGDTLVPLDIWWFDAEGVLLGGTEMSPCPDDPCVSYASPAPIMWALETPAGEYELEVGTVLSTVGNP
jgi:hypothetical protein